MLQSRHLGHVARAAFVFQLATLTGCSDLLLVEIGEEHVEPFELDRSYEIADTRLAECPTGERELDPGADALAASVVFAPHPNGCVVDIRVDGAIMMNAIEVTTRAVQLESQGDVGAVRAIDLEVKELALEDGDGVPLPLGGVHSMSVELDDQLVLSRAEVDAIRDGEAPRITLPQSFLERFIEAIRNREALRADLRLRFVLGDPDETIPNRLNLHALLQPILLVDVLDAKL